MKKISLILILLFITFKGKASNDTLSKTVTSDWGVQLSGMINPHLWLDSRQTIGGRDGQLLLWPKRPMYDANGKDINAAPSMNMLAITSRFGLLFSCPDILNAKASGYMEADFSGSVEMANNSLRLRHAFVQLDWEKSSLLFGQFWHPLVVHEIMPVTGPLNMGAPFHPYARHMQVRYTQHLGRFQLFGAAVAQRDNSSDGPQGANSEYLRNAVIPNLHLQLHYEKGNFFAGVGSDMKMLKPRLYTVSPITNDTFKTNTLLYSYALTAFAKYHFPLWDIRFQSSLAQNESENLMIGGYAESPLNANNQHTYTNNTSFSNWLNIYKCMGKWRPGLFLGYAKSLGFSQEIEKGSMIFGRGIKGNDAIDYLWRVQPRLAYFANKRLQIYSDLEYTVAAFGDPDGWGHFTNSEPTKNLRVMAGMVFLF